MSNKDQFENRASFPWLWKSHSDQLHRAAILVWNATSYDAAGLDKSICYTVELYKPALLLMGLSLEALLKAIIIQKANLKPNKITIDGKFPKWFTTHNIKKLCGHADIKLQDDDTQRMADWLTAAVDWHSKYPTPKTLEKYVKFFEDVKLVNPPHVDFECYSNLRTEIDNQFRVTPVITNYGHNSTK